MHLWLAVMALAAYRKPRGHDMPRIRDYVGQLGTGIAGVVSPTRRDGLITTFELASTARNRLMHHADESRVTLGMLVELEAAAFELVSFELRRAGMAGY